MNRIKETDSSRIKHFSTYGLALFFVLTPFEYPLADMMTVSPLRIVGLFVMGLAALDILLQRVIKLDGRIILVALWLAYGLLTYFWTIDSSRFQSYYSIYMNNALMFLLLSMVSFTKQEATILKKAMVFGVGALLLYMTFVPGALAYSDYQHRLTLKAGTEDLDQNYLAALMLSAFGIVFYNLCNAKQKRIWRTLSVAFCLGIVYYTLLTGSRSGIIALLLIVLLTVNTSWKTRFLVGIPIIVILFVAFPFVEQYIPEEITERFSLSALLGQETESGTRLVIWRRALLSLQGLEALVGYGAGASQTVVGNALGKGDAVVHNHYLAMFVEFGLIGFLLINIPIFMMLIKAKKNDKSVAVAFAGILVMAFFLDVLTTKFFWSAMILLSVCCSARGNTNLKMENETTALG